jgi:serralysin
VPGTTDTLEIRAEDQTGWGGWASFVATAPALVIQTDTGSYGSTSLAETVNQYFLFAAGGTAGPELKYGGQAVVSGEFGAWTPIGAVQTASGYDIAWKDAAANEYTVWSTDNNGNYVANVIGAVSGNSYALETLETTFNQDLNGDGTVGLPTTVIQVDGSTSLTEIGPNYFLYQSGSGPALKYGGAAVTAGEFGTWAPIGAVQTSGGYEIAWKDAAANEYTVLEYR